MFMMSSTQPNKEVGFWSWWWSTNKTDATSRHILITLVPLFIFFWFMFLIKKRNNTMNLRLPPGPRGLPIVGYLPFLGSNLHQSFKELSSSYGAIFRIWLGMNEYIVVSSPSLAKEVLRDQDTVFANRLPTIALKSLLFGATDIAFSDYGHELRKMRKLFASEMMSRTSLDASYSLRIQHVTRMLNEIYMKAGEQVDIGAIVFLNLMSAGMSMIWGDKLEADTSSVINSEFRGVVNELFELLGKPNISDLFPFLARFDLQGIAHQMKIISSQCEKILNSVINCRNAEEDVERKDFLGFLLQLTECEDPTRSLTLPQVKAILMDAVIGGTDTTAATVEWGMAEILQHPKVLEKVQEELTEVVGLDSTVDEVHLPKLKYLKAVLKETLRLHPPLPLLIPHCPSEPSTIGGFSISKGVSILVNAYAIHRDPKYWEDPLVFQPERFLSTDNLDYKGNHFNYLPFGSGRRICAGISLAERMSLLFLASLLHAFRWELPNDTAQVDFSEKIGLVMKKAKPLFAVPTPKLSSSELYSHKD